MSYKTQPMDIEAFDLFVREVWRFKIWFNPPFLLKCLYQVRVITVFTVFVCLYNYEFWLSLCKIVRSSVILLLPLFSLTDDQNEESKMKMKAKINFYVKKVGHHKNVLDFIGSVEDDVRMYW